MAHRPVVVAVALRPVDGSGRATDHDDRAREDANDAELVEPGTDGGLHLSRRHLQIEFQHGQYVVSDRDSACGTIVNDTRIGGDRTGGRIEVGGGALIRLGTESSPVVFRFLTEDTPVRETHASNPQSAEPRQRRSASVDTILVVDDDEAVRDLIRRMLELEGYNVLTARDGHHALAISKQHAGLFRLLLIDIVMPRMSGYVLAERLRAQRPGTNVVFITGQSDISAAVQAGLHGSRQLFLLKPFSRAELMRAVKSAKV